MATAARKSHAQDIADLQKRIARHRKWMAKAWSRIKTDPELLRLQEKADQRRLYLEKRAVEFCWHRLRTLVPLENKLKAAKAAHENLVSRKLSDWVIELRGSSANRSRWSLAWFSDNEKFALVRKPAHKLHLANHTTQNYGVRHELFRIGRKTIRVCEFLGKMTKADWVIVHQHVAAAKAAAGVAGRPRSPDKTGASPPESFASAS